MKILRNTVACAAAILCLFAAQHALAACSFSTGEEACDYFFAGLCPSSAACVAKDCLGRNFGDEAMFIPGGKYPKLWIAETDGSIVDGVGYLCPHTTNDGVSIIRFGELAHCSVTLLTEDHMYIELFASIPETECMAWVECRCY